MNKIKLSLIVPVFNEETRLPQRIKEYVDYIPEHFDYEFIFIDGGSTDNSFLVLNELSKKINCKIINNPESKGRGDNIRLGVFVAEGEFILEVDADFPVSPSHVSKFIDFLEKNPYELVIGSRELVDSTFDIPQPAIRVFMGKVFHKIFRIFFGTQFNDVMCGFKLYRHDAAKTIFSHTITNTYITTGEVVFIANKLNIPIKELPICWIDGDNSKVRVVKDTFSTLGSLIKMFFHTYPMNIEFIEAKKSVLKKYHKHGWVSIFSHIRFFTAPYASLASIVPKKGTIIDLGCGYGIFSNLLALLSKDRHIIGIEKDEIKFERAHCLTCAQYSPTDIKIPNVEYINQDILQTTLPPADCILLIHVLHHLNSYEEQRVLIKKCSEMLKNDGMLIITEIDKYPVYKFILSMIADRLLYPKDGIHYRYPNTLIPLLEQNGFNVNKYINHQGTPFSHVTYICRK